MANNVDYLDEHRDFNMLSLRDLIDARDHYHMHLAHKKNVIATAVGRYLIRKTDPWPDAFTAGRSDERAATKAANVNGDQAVKTASANGTGVPASHADPRDVGASHGPSNTAYPANEQHPVRQLNAARPTRGKRTLENSHVRPYSWPCVLVFVEEWCDPHEFGCGPYLGHEDMVPSALYMPDGRVVPVCVVEAPLEDAVDGEVSALVFPNTRIGGGYPAIVKVQHKEHVASIGCLVTDGHLVYALTNRHVTGNPGQSIETKLAGQPVPIGTSSSKQLGRMSFPEVYDGWPGKNVYVNLDVGLIQIDDLNLWTAKVFGIGQIGKLTDLSVENISLKLIDCPVRAYGCVSRQMRGRVQALFYRYKSVGGFEYVADFLIGARDGEPLATHPGDSGTLWLLETTETNDPAGALRPLAVQWGGHVFVSGDGKSQAPYALATCLSTVCNLLEVDLVRDWNLDRYEYWGEMGHYTIGAKACDLVTDPQLVDLMTANQDNIGFPDPTLRDESKYKIHQANYDFVPLADVADDVWRNNRPPFSNKNDPNNDSNNHFADMDQVATTGKYADKTLMDLFEADPASVDRQVWLDFYDSLGGDTKPGALPFRVWQIFNEMVRFLNDTSGPDIPRFLCAAGCLAHYVGDACQPLHVSRLHHGNPPLKSGTVPYKVHEVYESEMLDAHADDIVEGLNQRIEAAKSQEISIKDDIADGQGAAVRVVELMQLTFKKIPPADLVAAYNEEDTPQTRLDRLWNDFGELTMDSMFEGCRCMADIWQSAWKLGPASLQNLTADDLGPVDRKLLRSFYRDNQFLLSRELHEMGPLL
jgi:hypothetical protein